jgi:hypothetical protein
MKAHPLHHVARAAIFAASVASINFTVSAALAQIHPLIQIGDLNFDNQLNGADGPALATALVDPAGFKAAHGITDVELLQRGDINADALVNNQDINSFLFFLKNSTEDGGPFFPVPASHQGMLYFSTSATNPGATSPTNTAATNPHITIAQGSSTSLYLWAQVNDKVAINGLSLAVQSSNPSVVTATDRSIDNPTNASGARWNGLNPGILGPPGSATLWSGENAVFVNGNLFGLDGANFTSINGTYVSQGANADGSGEPMVGSLLVGSLTLVGNTPGTTNLFLSTGDGVLSYEEGYAGSVQFGAGDPLVSAGLAGLTSSLADATITVTPVPEPTALALAVIGAIGLLHFKRGPTQDGGSG